MQTLPRARRPRKLFRTDRVGVQSEPEELDACRGPQKRRLLPCAGSDWLPVLKEPSLDHVTAHFVLGIEFAVRLHRPTRNQSFTLFIIPSRVDGARI